MNYIIASGILFGGLVYCSVPLYRIFCSSVGTNTAASALDTAKSGSGTKADSTIVSVGKVMITLVESAAEMYMHYFRKALEITGILPESQENEVYQPFEGVLPAIHRITPVQGAQAVRVKFIAARKPSLHWKFSPLTEYVDVVPGETALAFFEAENVHPTEAVIGVATYSVVPPEVAPHFHKIQCFCFEEQRLLPGEKVELPVFFFIDPEMLQDPNSYLVRDVVLSYTFFPSKIGKN